VVDYLAHADSLLDNPVINPNWSQQARPLQWIEKIVVHHEAQFRPSVYDNTPRYEAEAAYQNNTSIPGSLGLQYHAKIDNVGTITWTRPLTTILWHCGNLDVNNHSIAVCLDGNMEDQMPTREQLESLKQLLDYWTSPVSGAFPANKGDVYPHQEFSATACCGTNLIPYVNHYRTSLGNPAMLDVPYDHPELQPPVVPVDAIQAPVAATTPEVAPTPAQEVTPVVEPVVAPDASAVPVPTHVAETTPAPAEVPASSPAPTPTTAPATKTPFWSTTIGRTLLGLLTTLITPAILALQNAQPKDAALAAVVLGAVTVLTTFKDLLNPSVPNTNSSK